MKATTLLSNQHREVEAIFKAIKTGKGDLSQLVEKLADSLVAHMAIEQSLFYPAVKKVDEDLIFESFEEHAAAELVLKRLLATDASDPTFKAKVTVLEEMISHHVKEEENELFPEVDKAMQASALEALGKEMETMFAECLEEGYEATLTKVVPKTSVDESLMMMRASGAPRTSAPSLS